MGNVLIVDDEPSLRRLAVRVLAMLGLKATAVATLEEALHEVGQAAYDVVLVDLQLGDGSGLHLLERLAEVRPECRRVLMTGGSVPDIGLPDGTAWLLKPFGPDSLAAACGVG